MITKLSNKEELIEELIFRVKLLNNAVNKFFENKSPTVSMALIDVNRVLKQIEEVDNSIVESHKLENYSYELIDLGAAGEPNIQSVNNKEDGK